MALESFPPLALVAGRFLISGILMFAGALWMGAAIPRGRELWLTAMNGVLILGIGNGCLTWAETLIPSGLAALFLTTSPFWMVGLEAIFGGDKLHAPTVAGLLIGLCGAAILFTPTGHPIGAETIKGFLILQLGCFCWNAGSISQRLSKTVAHPVVGGAVQQLAAGIAFLLPALLAPEHPIVWTSRGVLALLYLVVFGSIVGYSSYVYALEKLPVAVVSIYTYVNPVVALLLGWLIYREPLGAREWSAMAVIFAGVAIVKRFGKAQRRQSIPIRNFCADGPADRGQKREQDEHHNDQNN